MLSSQKHCTWLPSTVFRYGPFSPAHPRWLFWPSTLIPFPDIRSASSHALPIYVLVSVSQKQWSYLIPTPLGHHPHDTRNGINTWSAVSISSFVLIFSELLLCSVSLCFSYISPQVTMYHTTHLGWYHNQTFHSPQHAIYPLHSVRMRKSLNKYTAIKVNFLLLFRWLSGAARV